MKLAKAIFEVPPKVAAEIIDKFTLPFPSLQSVSGADVVNSVCITHDEHCYGDNGDKRIAEILDRIDRNIEEESCDGEWPASFNYWEDEPSWCKNLNITITPHCGDRFITVKGGVLGHGHGEAWSGVAVYIDCEQRPSAVAMMEVIEFINEHPEYVSQVFWELKEYSQEKMKASLTDLVLA